MALQIQDFENPLFRTRVSRRNIQGRPAFEGTTFTNEYVQVGFTCIIATGMLSVVNMENQLLFLGKIASGDDFEKALKKADRKQKEIYLGKTKTRVVGSTEVLRLLAGEDGKKKAAPRQTPKPARPAKKYKKGDTVTMLLHGAGVTSKEKHEVLLVKGNVITIDDGDEEDRRRFDTRTGKCLNDNNFMGFSREIEL